MPTRIPRDEAVARIVSERAGEPCLICALRDGRAGAGPMLCETQHTVTVLSRYALRWGHALVLLREHCDSLLEVRDEAWAEASREALTVARAIESTLAPLRCWMGSFGTSRVDIPMSSPHLHVHLIPVYDPADRPSTVLQWGDGVYQAKDAEWTALARRLRAAIEATRGENTVRTLRHATR